MFFYLFLRFKSILEIITACFVSHKKFRSYQVAEFLAKHFVDDNIVNKRFAEALLFEPYTLLTKFIDVHRHTGNKSSHDPLYGMCRDAPDTEESQDVIDPECVEIIAHLFKPLFPPQEAVFLHPFPIICWEPPVLTYRSKIIWWCSCLPAHVILIGPCPCITSITIDPDWNIT